MQWLLGSGNRTVYLAVVQNSIVDNACREVCGRAFVRDLIDRGTTSLDGHEVVLVTHHRMLHRPVATRMLALFPSKDFLDELDAIPLVSELLVVPWIPDDIRDWTAARNPAPLGQSQQARSPLHLGDPVVEVAIRNLDSSINRANGLVGGRDREIAVQIFRILRREGLPYNPDEVKAFLISECGWDAPLAERAKVIATQILEGRNLQEGQRRFVPNIVELWREEAQRSAGNNPSNQPTP